MTNNNIAIYTRVFVPTDDMDGGLAALRRYAAGRQLKPIEFRDVVPLACQPCYPRLDELMRAAEQRQFGVVAVRDLRDFAYAMDDFCTAMREFEHLEIEFVTLSGVLDTGTDEGRRFCDLLDTLVCIEEQEEQEARARTTDRERHP